MSGESWLIAVSVGVIALAFVALVVYLIVTLVSLRKTLKATNEICMDLENKMHAFDPYMRMISGLGHKIEKKAVIAKEITEEAAENVQLKRTKQAETIVNTSLEVAEWALLGLGLWKKIKERR